MSKICNTTEFIPKFPVKTSIFYFFTVKGDQDIMVHMLSLRMCIKNMDTTDVIHIFILSINTLLGKPLIYLKSLKPIL